MDIVTVLAILVLTIAVKNLIVNYVQEQAAYRQAMAARLVRPAYAGGEDRAKGGWMTT